MELFGQKGLTHLLNAFDRLAQAASQVPPRHHSLASQAGCARPSPQPCAACSPPQAANAARGLASLQSSSIAFTASRLLPPKNYSQRCVR